VAKRVGYIWQKRWNEKGYECLILKYSCERPAQLTGKNRIKIFIK